MKEYSPNTPAPATPEMGAASFPILRTHWGLDDDTLPMRGMCLRSRRLAGNTDFLDRVKRLHEQGPDALAVTLADLVGRCGAERDFAVVAGRTLGDVGAA